MPIELITLRSAFGDVLSANNSIDLAALRQMIHFQDDYNDESMYKYDPSIAEGVDMALDGFRYETADDGGLQLYVYGTDESGNQSYMAIPSLDSFIPSSVSLFIKVKGANTETYVDVYSLYSLDINAVLAPSARNSVFSYGDTAVRVTATVYSMACRQKKLLEQYTRDITVISDEQRLMGVMGNSMTDLITSLTALDANITDASNPNRAKLPPELLAFFLRRGLFSRINETGVFTQEFVQEMDQFLDGIDANGKKVEISHKESFIAWTQLVALIRHPMLLNGPISANMLTTEVTASGAVTNMYDPMYWQTATDMEGNENSALIAGEHWVFDPRLRNADGELLARDGSPSSVVVWDGVNQDKCIYFNGFSTGAAGSETPDYSLVWFHSSPPTDHTDHLRGMAASMRQIVTTSNGTESFLPEGYLNEEGGYCELTDKFKTWLTEDGAKSHITANISDENKILVSAMSTGTETPTANTTRASIKDAAAGPWPYVTAGGTIGSNAYDAILSGPIETKTSTVEMSSVQVSNLAEALRIYMEQVNNDGTVRSNRLQSTQQQGQTCISVATNLLKSIQNIQMDTVQNNH
ncbi:MAG: hypothetical protein LBP65_00185 [Puniceicoccales bacterium]|jgi:hypothetical protein|nr:hypothetical protein [Puniceicoccales bacterium]